MKMKIRCNGTSTKPRPAGTLPWDLNFRGLCSGPSLAAPLSTKGVCKTNEMCPPPSSTLHLSDPVPGPWDPRIPYPSSPKHAFSACAGLFLRVHPKGGCS